MTMDNGTWLSPGRCPKCNMATSRHDDIIWHEHKPTIHPMLMTYNADDDESYGHLRAVCPRCGYWWRIKAADGLDGTVTDDDPTKGWRGD